MQQTIRKLKLEPTAANIIPSSKITARHEQQQTLQLQHSRPDGSKQQHSNPKGAEKGAQNKAPEQAKLRMRKSKANSKGAKPLFQQWDNKSLQKEPAPYISKPENEQATITENQAKLGKTRVEPNWWISKAHCFC
ncbi:hypothetical protein U1Q18_039749 [Sarracenia purpurea var. burkii]